ncbi:hypothetical protein BDZ85DRAFT_262220 [Elsinoe ampelina]|uniref:FAD-binding FR-type domain-containing protein n=1 Tax=Elsinoe ampelina TaxID=302913 RepID=A0A6A6GDU1_9PEZI|nr:hypothetical protein BDZ85DRAFT_262220 [Elsinoe ampelina]
MAFYQAKEWHEGEQEMHRRLRVPEMDNPAMPGLSPQLAAALPRMPLLALGTLDSEGRPWTTLWGGEKGFSQSLGGGMMGVRTPVPSVLDPVVEILVGSKADGEVVKQEGQGRLVSGLIIDLETRKRVKLAGRMVAGALAGQRNDDQAVSEGLLQLVVKVEESLGNCPKYLNKKAISPAHPKPRLASDLAVLGSKAVDLVHRSDLFFLSTTHSEHDMDTNHRGGPSGFVRVLSHGDKTVLVYPEYSGNRLYQSLGNMITNPKAGFCFPDFESGDCLYLTGTTEILVGKDAANLIPKSNLAVKITVDSARLVESILPLRGSSGEQSPYNPTVRYLANEKEAPRQDAALDNRARLLKQTVLSPTVSRFQFSLSNAATYHAGQYVTLDFSEHLDVGYSHMRDDDPRSLNDDFIRTFTVSSPPGSPPHPSRTLADDEFEITIRKVGVVTDFLFKHGKDDRRYGSDLEVGVKGFGGNFTVAQDETVVTGKSDRETCISFRELQ